MAVTGVLCAICVNRIERAGCRSRRIQVVQARMCGSESGMVISHTITGNTPICSFINGQHTLFAWTDERVGRREGWCSEV